MEFKKLQFIFCTLHPAIHDCGATEVCKFPAEQSTGT